MTESRFNTLGKSRFVHILRLLSKRGTTGGQGMDIQGPCILVYQASGTHWSVVQCSIFEAQVRLSGTVDSLARARLNCGGRGVLQRMTPQIRVRRESRK